MTEAGDRAGARVLGAQIDAVDAERCLDRISGWASRGESRSVFLCNVHSVVTARRDPAFARVLGAADLAVPDGAPIAWCLRRVGFARQRRVGGPDLMWACCELATRARLPIFLYGASADTLRRLRARLAAGFPGVPIAGSAAPPFCRLTEAEDARAVRDIARSGARIVFVALGCPKQEEWIDGHRGAIPAVMVGVGAAFDFHAGTVKRAPRWMQDFGLEWLHRVAMEPRRLWRRYLVTNTLFLAYLAGELVGDLRRKAG